VAGAGAAALSIIPDRNYTPGVKDRKLENLHHVVEMARNRQFPIIVGTERNAPGNKFVDSFQTAELAPLLPVFLHRPQSTVKPMERSDTPSLRDSPAGAWPWLLAGGRAPLTGAEG
jgi:hypothetical protein